MQCTQHAPHSKTGQMLLKVGKPELCLSGGTFRSPSAAAASATSAETALGPPPSSTACSLLSSAGVLACSASRMARLPAHTACKLCAPS